MCAARRRDRGRRDGRRRPDRFDRREGPLPGRRDRGKSVPQYSEELLKEAAKVAAKDILKKEPPENTMGRLRSMGLNSKAAAVVYSHARDQVKVARRRIVAILMALGALLLLIGLFIAGVQNWPGTGKPWHTPWAGGIFAALGLVLMIISYVRWRRLIRG